MLQRRLEREHPKIEADAGDRKTVVGGELCLEGVVISQTAPRKLDYEIYAAPVSRHVPQDIRQSIMPKLSVHSFRSLIS